MWTESENALIRTFEFGNFKEALAFINKVGELAERMEHHPDISLANYRYVTVSTTTHDEGAQITCKDRDLARAIDMLV